MTNLNVVDAIEVSSLCNNHCPYCPAPKQGEHRPVGLMTMETFAKAIKVVDYCVAKGTQRQLNMYGIGEPTLNPLLCEFIKIARSHLPARFNLHLTTNGNTMTDELAKNLKEAGITKVDITGHNPKAAALACQILRRYHILDIVTLDFIAAANDWAGQVDWIKPDYAYPCPWLHFGQVMIMWDGRITRCCMDAWGRGIIGTVDDQIGGLEWGSFELCKTCHQLIPGDPRLNGATFALDPDTGAVRGKI